jgi:hypothetical protein
MDPGAFLYVTLTPATGLPSLSNTRPLSLA